MFGSKTYVRSVTFTLGPLAREEVVIEFTRHLGQVLQESIFRITKEKQKLTK